MPAMRRPLLTVLAATTVALALTSCGDDGPQCVDDVVTIGTGSDLELTDDCALVRVNGTDSIVDVTGIAVDGVEINGDRNRVVADVVPDAVRISGQENEVDGVRLGTVEIHGDRNTISAEDDVAAIAVHGNDNAATASALGEVNDGGDRNTIAEGAGS